MWLGMSGTPLYSGVLTNLQNKIGVEKLSFVDLRRGEPHSKHSGSSLLVDRGQLKDPNNSRRKTIFQISDVIMDRDDK